jgi:hypothetical protein
MIRRQRSIYVRPSVHTVPQGDLDVLLKAQVLVQRTLSIDFLEPFAEEDRFGRAEWCHLLVKSRLASLNKTSLPAMLVVISIRIIALEVPLSRDGTRMDDGVRIPGILTPHHWYKYKQPILGLKDRSSLD